MPDQKECKDTTEDAGASRIVDLLEKELQVSNSHFERIVGSLP